MTSRGSGSGKFGENREGFVGICWRRGAVADLAVAVQAPAMNGTGAPQEQVVSPVSACEMPSGVTPAGQTTSTGSETQAASA